MPSLLGFGLWVVEVARRGRISAYASQRRYNTKSDSDIADADMAARYLYSSSNYAT